MMLSPSLGPSPDKTVADKDTLNEKGKSDYLKSLGMLYTILSDFGPHYEIMRLPDILYNNLYRVLS